MCKFLLCDDKNILCIHQICETCSSFPNLADFKRTFSQLHCSDGCLKKTAIYHLVQREKLTVCVYFETSHWKSKSDGLGSVVKSYVSREIVANELIIRNRQDMYEFCVANFTVVEGETSHGKYHTLSG